MIEAIALAYSLAGEPDLMVHVRRRRHVTYYRVRRHRPKPSAPVEQAAAREPAIEILTTRITTGEDTFRVRWNALNDR